MDPRLSAVDFFLPLAAHTSKLSFLIPCSLFAVPLPVLGVSVVLPSAFAAPLSETIQREALPFRVQGRFFSSRKLKGDRKAHLTLIKYKLSKAADRVEGLINFAFNLSVE